ncbi:MAG: hypothetical protein J6Z79_02630 [Clostridia bacterium]|nr:hypothetical protein [Clostridia bacterium]
MPDMKEWKEVTSEPKRNEAQDRFVEADWSNYYDTGYGRGADVLKFFLMIFVFFASFGFPTFGFLGAISGYVPVLCQFVVPTFFILCGFFTLPKDEAVRGGKLSRGMKRSGILFLALFVVLFAFNVIILLLQGTTDLSNLLSKRLWFNFLVMSYWPFPRGETILFIRNLFYAYVVLLILHKTLLLRALKIPFLLLGAVGLLLGEFSGLIRLDLFGYGYLPANAVTYAIPLMLFGALMREKFSLFLSIHPVLYWIMIVGGVALSFGEFQFLSSLGVLRYLGMSVGSFFTAVGLAGWALVHPKINGSFFVLHGRSYARRMYYLSQPMFFVIMLAAELLKPALIPFLMEYASVILFAICFALAFLIGFVKDQILFIRKMDREPGVGEAPR